MKKPDAVFNTIADIPETNLSENNIKGIILDIDNTMITLDGEEIPNAIKWTKQMKEQGYKICIASNSKNERKVLKVAKELDCKYFLLSFKPLKRGLKKAQNELNLKPAEIAEIGDQLFTDVWGAKRMGMYSILVKPYSPEKHWISELKRKIERHVLAKILQK